MNPPLANPAPPATAARARWTVWLLPAFILACWLLAIRHLAADWTLNEQYHYGWLVPLLALYLVKVRFEKFPPPDAPPSPNRARFILAVIVFAAVLTMPLREANMQWRSMGWWLTALAMGATLLGFAQAGGGKWVRHFAFPVLFFCTAVPHLRTLEEPAMSWLMQHNARIAVEVLHWLGVDAQARGNLIALPSGTLGVDEACSGIRSLQGTLMLTLFLGEILALSWPRRLALLGAGAGWALVTNVGRTVALGWAAHRGGPGAVEGWHDPAGYTVLAICSALTGATAWLLRGAPAPAEAALPLDRAAIAQRFRALALPGAAGLALLAAGLVLNEFWFRLHELDDVPLAPWRFRMPHDRPDFQAVKIAPAIRADLRFDEAANARWKDDAGRRWQAMYFRWRPGRNAAQTVGVHDPRACLAAVGMTEAATLPPFEIARGELRLPVDAYHFRDGPQDVFVFNCLAEDVRRGEAQRRVRADNSIASRFSAALAGKRHRGQRRIEVAVWGAPDAATAAALFRELMSTQIEVGAPASLKVGR